MTFPEIHFHTLNDGRTLAYCEYGDPAGDPAGDPIFYAQGGPSSWLEGCSFGSYVSIVCQINQVIGMYFT